MPNFNKSKGFNFGNKEADYGQKRDFHKKFDYSGEPDKSHEPSVREADKTAPTAFKLRSGNGPLQFKQMGASPAKNLFEAFSSSLTGKKEGGLVSEENKITSKKDATDIGGSKELEVNAANAPKESTEAPKPKEKNWKEKKSEFKTQKKDFRKTRKDFRKGNKEEIAELKASGASKEEIKAAKKVNKQEQKDLRSAHKDDNKAAKEKWKSDPEYQAHRAQQKKELSEGLMDLGQSSTFQGKGAKSFVELQSDRDVGKRADADAKAKEIATTEASKKDAINATQKAEMHKSNLAVNEQQIASGKALEAQRLQGIKVAEENISGEKELGSTENTSNDALNISKNSGGKDLRE